MHCVCPWIDTCMQGCTYFYVHMQAPDHVFSTLSRDRNRAVHGVSFIHSVHIYRTIMDQVLLCLYNWYRLRISSEKDLGFNYKSADTILCFAIPFWLPAIQLQNPVHYPNLPALEGHRNHQVKESMPHSHCEKS